MYRYSVNKTQYKYIEKSITINEFNKKKYFIIDVQQSTDVKTNNYKLNIICLDNNSNKYYYKINNIIPFFDIEFNDNIGNIIKHKYEKLLLDKLILKNNTLILESIKLKPFNYYSDSKVLHLRLNFKNISDYSYVLNVFNKNEILKEYLRQNETPYNYYNKVIQYNNIITCENIPKNTLLMTWDIETYSYDKTRIPDGLVNTDICFLICGTFHNYNSDKILSSFAFTTQNIEQNTTNNRTLWLKILDKIIKKKTGGNTKESSKSLAGVGLKHKNNYNIYDNILSYLNIINFDNLNIYRCKNEKDVFIQFVKMIQNIKPDIITGFNDHSYDWVYLKNKIENYYPDIKRLFYECFNILEFYVSDREIKPFKNSFNKISADMGNIDIVYPNSNYIIFIDTRTEFRKMFPKDIESNLNYYLKKFNLSLKSDLPYKKLFKIFETNDVDGMSDAAFYCLNDALRCHELLIKKQNLNEHYNMSFMTGITLKNSINRANGFKVFNYILKEGITHNYSFIYNKLEIDDNNDFCGGYVADPIYGLNLDCPVIGLDFASLYPNIQRTFNLGPDTLIRKDDILKYKNSKIPIREINGRFIVDHLENENNKSIIVKILTNLFNQRTIIKKSMLNFKTDREFYNNILSFKLNLSLCLFKKFNFNNTIINNLLFEFLGLDDLNEIINDLDQKQKTIKVLMNSFYGLLGSPTSLLYCKFIATTITKIGREMLCKVRDYVVDNGFIAHYSDTDSVYCSCKKIVFNDVVLNFKNNIINAKELFAEKINITKKFIKILLNDLNSFLKFTYKYDYIKLAYEEVLFPVFFIAKKMYFGVEHMETINYDDIDNYLFMRGYSPVRRNTTKLTKHIIINTVIKKLFSLDLFSQYHLNNFINVFDLIKKFIFDIVTDFRNNFYSIDYFIKSDRYSPNKNNIRINTFINKLKNRFDSLSSDDLKRKYKVPEPFERFSYIYVLKSDIIKFNGVIQKTEGLGVIMEYPSFLEDFNAELSYKKYFDSDLANELGCLIDHTHGKKYASKLFDLFNDYYDNKNEISNIMGMELTHLIESKNDIKKKNQKDFRNISKNKTIDYNNLKKDLFISFPKLYSFNIISDPNNFINNIINHISKLNFDLIHQKKSDIYLKLYNNKYYLPNLVDLNISLNNFREILFSELSDNIQVFNDIIYENLDFKIEEYLTNKELIIDFDFNDSYNSLVLFVNSHFNFLNNLEKTVENYYDILIKIYKYNSYHIYINKLKKLK
tara:strand:- start:206 stop:3919 length:3714 start_codon:yes stop_codon:yes gene_type:complete